MTFCNAHDNVVYFNSFFLHFNFTAHLLLTANTVDRRYSRQRIMVRIMVTDYYWEAMAMMLVM